MDFVCGVDDLARAWGTTPKTIRLWIAQEGLPVLRRGRRGPGQGASIDLSRLGSWLRRRRRENPTLGAGLVRETQENPLRQLAELQARRSAALLARCLVEWGEEGAGGRHSPESIGLSPAQARAAAGAFWKLTQLALEAYLRIHLERDCSQLFGCDPILDPHQGGLYSSDEPEPDSVLDLLASMLLEADVPRGTWPAGPIVETPGELADFLDPQGGHARG